MPKYEQLRSRAKKVIAEYHRDCWIAGELLQDVLDKKKYESWDFADFETYCEEDLGISCSRASRLVRVLTVFGPYRESDDLDDVSWTALAEALPIANKVSVEEAIKLAKCGLADIRRWKEARRKRQQQRNLPLEDQQDWHRVRIGAQKFRVPPDVYQDLLEALELSRAACAESAISIATEENPWELIQSLAIAAIKQFRGPEWMTSERIDCPPQGALEDHSTLA